MKTPPDDFQDLMTLLAWKRHEVPPPGYFDTLPDRIMARLELPSAEPALSWWRRWFAAPAFQPVLSAAYSLAVCGLLLSGISLSPSVSRHSEAAPRPNPIAALTATAPLVTGPESLRSRYPSQRDLLPALISSVVMEVAPVAYLEKARADQILDRP